MSERSFVQSVRLTDHNAVWISPMFTTDRLKSCVAPVMLLHAGLSDHH